METKPDKIWLRFKHGVGDAVQFGIVLKHLRNIYPDAYIYLETKPGREALFRHLVNEIQPLQYPWNQWEGKINKQGTFGHSDHGWGVLPSTKVTQCLYDEFDLEPFTDLYRYTVDIKPEARAAVQDWYSTLWPRVVAIHYEGVSCPRQKNIPRPLVEAFCKTLVAGGVTPVLLDWSYNKVQDGATIFTPDHLPQDSDHIAALIDAAELFVGIDSGPAHIAGALDTPSYVVWLDFFPPHNYDLADNVCHFVPESALLEYEGRAEYNYLKAAYRHVQYYDLEGLILALAAHIVEDYENENSPANIICGAVRC